MTKKELLIEAIKICDNLNAEYKFKFCPLIEGICHKDCIGFYESYVEAGTFTIHPSGCSVLETNFSGETLTISDVLQRVH